MRLFGDDVVSRQHEREHKFIPTEHQADDRRREANVKLMFDTYHALYRNEVASDYVYRMKDKLHHVHIADTDRLPPGMGRCNFPSVLKALKEIGYPGYLSMEVGFHTRQADPDWYAEASIQYLKEQLQKLGWQYK